MAKKDTVLIDGHLHLFEALSEEYPREVHPLFPAELSSPIERFFRVMDENGIDYAVIVPLSVHDEYLRYCLTNYPDRLRGIGIYDAGAADSVEDFTKRRDNTGISGLRVFDLRAPGEEGEDDIRNFKIYPLLRFMEREEAVLWYYWSTEQIPLLEKMLTEFPGLPVVMNHLGFTQAGFEVDEWGRPKVQAEVPPASLPSLLESGEKHKNLYVMFSGEYAFSKQEFPYLDCKPVVEQIYSVFGADRMFWASDYPWVLEKPGYGRQLGLIDHYLPNIPEDEKGMIMGGTAAGLFGFPVTSRT